MKVTEQQIAERYASMSDEELETLDPGKLTPEAAALRADELKRRGRPDSPAQEEVRAQRERADEATRRKKYGRQLAAVALVAAALLMELVVVRFVHVPQFLLAAVIIVLCGLALYVLRGRR